MGAGASGARHRQALPHGAAPGLRLVPSLHLEDAAIRDVARELKATEAQVGHYIQDARTVLRRIVVDEIREYVHDEAEIARELDELFKGWK